MKRIPIDPQELANRHQAWLARDVSNYAYLYEREPEISEYHGKWLCPDTTTIRIDPVYDIQWPEGQNWRNSLYEPEPEILPCPRGGEVVVHFSELFGIWRVESFSVELGSNFYMSGFSARSQAIRAWNAVVREIRQDSSRTE
jgi:hypothetical protein